MYRSITEVLAAWCASMLNREDMFVGGVVITSPTTKQGDYLGVYGVVNTIQAEDGSGYNYNVTIAGTCGEHTLFVRFPRTMKL